MEVVIIIVIILSIALGFIVISNKFNKYSIKIEEALSGIDIALAKRYEIITKMVATVKGYTKHEKEILFEIVKLRQDMTISEKLQENNKMDTNESKIALAVEQYPDIKSNENFMLLQKAIVEVEEHLQAARRMYNSNVSIYNQMLESFPQNIVGKIKGLEKKKFFEATETDKVEVEM